MKLLAGLLLVAPLSGAAQTTDSLKNQYLAELRTTGRTFSSWFYPNRDKLYALPENTFVFKIDSARQKFTALLENYIAKDKNADAAYIKSEQEGIHYFFDKFILDYPYFHEMQSGKKTSLTPAVQKRLNKNLADFNKPELLSNIDFKNYVDGFLHEKTNAELKKPFYKTMDNQRLNSVLHVIPIYFTNPTCKSYWEYIYLLGHLDDWGVKNTDKAVQSFLATCTDTSLTNKLNEMYLNAIKERSDHLVKTYKKVGSFDLDIHLFLPDSGTAKRPVIVYFSGGSWTKGSPEWSFYSCRNYAKKGWVAAAVEYRIADRHGTTPFEAVMDARSAIRWLRMHATEYNIDTNRIVASGNSAGGHLVLATALAEKWNERSDDLRYSPSPNLLLVNSGVYDLFGDGTPTWISKPLKDKNTVKEISPVHLIRKGLPPMLLLHGTADQSVPYATAVLFESEMKKIGNDFEFHTLEGAPHEIWFDRRFTPTVVKLREEFLKKYGYE